MRIKITASIIDVHFHENHFWAASWECKATALLITISAIRKVQTLHGDHGTLPVKIIYLENLILAPTDCSMKMGV